MISGTSFQQDILPLDPDLGAMYLELQRQFDRLSALRSIDLAIMAGLELKQTLCMILEQLTAQLGMDAAAVLLLDPKSNELEYSASVGFRMAVLEGQRLRPGEAYAGRAAAGRSAITVRNMLEGSLNLLRPPAFLREGFISYHALPLTARGQLLGVLEVFGRRFFEPDQDWLDFMNMLAGQTAIAIDSAVMFQNLQKSNADLALAYDKTIEGWTHALDLRDPATQDHTRRVVEMTLALAIEVGLPELDMIHIRRGATLHDIGKVAIPDSILHKPGPLDEHEWTIMRRHPLIAVDLLSPIPHLVPALDIPRSHHEKWDGSGYPLGLAGEEIPLSARVFAVVDVLDALTSDRPYRKAWSRAEALRHIREQSGRHFDPAVLSVFLKMRDP